jgi:ABC-type nitrate/sulfonate/bicarbonate transport system ATPase subunit
LASMDARHRRNGERETMSIKIRGLNKSFGEKRVISNLDLDLPVTGIVGMTGPSGCGKTTLLRILAGLAEPDSGKIEGIDFRKISMVFQEDRLLPWLSALGNLAAVLPCEAQVCEWLDKMRLAECAAQYPAELSGGMKRRIALARALAFESDVLLLDEPFTGLDIELVRLMHTYIRKTSSTRLVVLVTHDLDSLGRLSDISLEAAGPPLLLSEKLNSAAIV